MAKAVTVGEFERERLARLQAEWRLASTQADLARLRFETEAGALARKHGIDGPFGLDLEAARIVVPEPQPPTAAED